MQFGYTILYVPNVAATVTFYEKAFGLTRRFVLDSGEYGELQSGTTTLAFAAETMAASNGVSIRPAVAHDPAPAFELGFVSDTPEEAFDMAVAAGATPIARIAAKPWGQRVGYVRDVNGFLIELCSPMPAAPAAT